VIVKTDKGKEVTGRLVVFDLRDGRFDWFIRLFSDGDRSCIACVKPPWRRKPAATRAGSERAARRVAKKLGIRLED
jgi:hypothetical protein